MASNQSFVVAGRNPVFELINESNEVDKVYVQRQLKGETIGAIKSLAYQKEIPIQLVPKVKLDRLFKGAHQGVVAFRSLIKYYNYNDIVQFAYEQGRTPLLLLLNGVTDIRNIGAIARTALGLDVDAILIQTKNSAPINGDAIKTSAGALNKLKVCRVNKANIAIEELKLSGFNIVGIDVGGSDNIKTIKKDTPTLIVMGAEGRGIEQEVLDQCDDILLLPISSELESYNVSVATAMVLYEYRRS